MKGRKKHKGEKITLVAIPNYPWFKTSPTGTKQSD